MTPGTYNIQDTVKGDTLDEVAFTVLEDGSPINLTGYAIKIMFKKYPLLVSSLTLSIGSGLSIIDAAQGQFKINEQIITLDVGQYFYDIQFTNGSEVRTYIKGEFNVLQEVTT